MNDVLEAIALAAGSETLSVAHFLRGLHRRRLLRPLLDQALVDHLICAHCRRLGIEASTDELQQAANRFRQRHGLLRAADTEAWLEKQGWTTLDFEQALERDLLKAKLVAHVTRERIPEHFAARQKDYTRVQLRELVVTHEDVAREMLAQLNEGAEFEDLARQHSLAPSRDRGGLLPLQFLKQLPSTLAQVVKTARPGDVLGPMASSSGFALFLVEAIQPPTVDADTAAFLRREIFDAWLRRELATSPATFPLLEQVRQATG